jgi:succinyl-CoA synthetase beta subunit
MARKKISEFAAKRIVYSFLELPYKGITVNTNDEYYDDLLSKMEEGVRYVLKVDQGVKQRKKNGLVVLDVTPANAHSEIEKLKEKGFNYFILEEFIEHEGGEFYLAIELEQYVDGL